MKLQTTILKVAIHRSEDNPIFGEGITHVSMTDESGGFFFVLEQFGPGQSISLCYEEIEKVLEVAAMLRAQGAVNETPTA